MRAIEVLARARSPFGAVLIALGACSLPQEGAPGRAAPTSARRPLLGESPPAAPLRIDAFWVPAMAIEPDTDDGEAGGGTELDADLADGAGWGVRLAHGSPGLELAASFLTTEHEERRTGTCARTYSGYGDVLVGIEIGSGAVRLRPKVGGGIGFAALDFDGPFDDTGGAAAQLRGGLELRLGDSAVLEADGAGFLWGYPGETIGYGAYLTLGMGVLF